MNNYNELLNLIKSQVGRNMNQSSDFDILAQAIKDKTNESLGSNTLKRLFGYKIKRVVPRRSTLDIIARFLNFEDYDSLLLYFGEDVDISNFAPIDLIEVDRLEKGTHVRIAYAPDRIFYLLYLGDFKFLVEEVAGSRNIQKDDILIISQLAMGHRFVVSHVYRDGQDLGSYEAAKENGLKVVEILDRP